MSKSSIQEKESQRTGLRLGMLDDRIVGVLRAFGGYVFTGVLPEGSPQNVTNLNFEWDPRPGQRGCRTGRLLITQDFRVRGGTGDFVPA